MNYVNIDEQLLGLLTHVTAKSTTKTIRPAEDYIPVTGMVLDKDDILLGVDAMLDGWLTAERFIEKFERQFAKYFGSKFLLLVNSGSSANLEAFYALTSPKLGDRQIKPGKEVITVAAGFPKTVNPLMPISKRGPSALLRIPIK